MPRYRLDLESSPDWQPLERVIDLCALRLRTEYLDAAVFMYMGRLVASDRPPVHMYKHVVTRRYLNLDVGGHAHRTVGWRPDAHDAPTVRCHPHRALLDAVLWVLRYDDAPSPFPPAPRSTGVIAASRRRDR